MEDIEKEPTSELHHQYPERKPSAYPGLKLNNTRALLPPEMLEEHDRALANIARRHNMPPPDDVVIS